MSIDPRGLVAQPPLPSAFCGARGQASLLASLISRSQDAQRRPRRIEGGPMAEAFAWLEEYRKFWERRYDALDTLLGQLQAKPPRSRRKRH